MEQASNTSVWTVVATLASAGTLLVAIVTATFALRSLRAARRSILADHERRRGDATMTAVWRFTDQSRQHWVPIYSAAKAENLKVRELLRTTQGTDARRAHQELLQELELLAVGCRLGFYSPQAVYDVARSMVRQCWDLSSAYIQDVRRGQFDTRRAQPSAYEHLEWLCHEFDRLENKRPKPPEGALKPLV